MINKKIAVFFDSENISSKYVNEIFNELAKIGELTINKAYHNWSNNQSENWNKVLSEFVIKPVQVFPNITGKNSIDMKTKGIENIGFGEEKTPSSLRKAFTTFFELPRIKKKPKPIKLLKKAINYTKNDDGFANIALVSQYLKNKTPSLNAQNYGLNRWSDIFKEEVKDFDISYRNGKSMMWVKIKEE